MYIFNSLHKINKTKKGVVSQVEHTCTSFLLREDSIPEIWHSVSGLGSHGCVCVCGSGMPAHLLEPVWGYAGVILFMFSCGVLYQVHIGSTVAFIPSLHHASAMRRNTTTWGCAPTTRGSFGRAKSPQHNSTSYTSNYCISLLHCYIHILEAVRATYDSISDGVWWNVQSLALGSKR